ncbi:hypothetical protein BV20DRAFT_549417 [Pilatotrama ljubarskyi]|nr:hypothetical protein BV20DRAFT_549417 [Pilatotrama ljubarskyi]
MGAFVLIENVGGMGETPACVVCLSRWSHCMLSLENAPALADPRCSLPLLSALVSLCPGASLPPSGRLLSLRCPFVRRAQTCDSPPPSPGPPSWQSHSRDPARPPLHSSPSAFSPHRANRTLHLLCLLRPSLVHTPPYVLVCSSSLSPCRSLAASRSSCRLFAPLRRGPPPRSLRESEPSIGPPRSSSGRTSVSCSHLSWNVNSIAPHYRRGRHVHQPAPPYTWPFQHIY